MVARVPTGIAELDRLLNGGLLINGAILLESVSGLGKEVFSYKIVNHLMSKGWHVKFLSTRRKDEIIADAEGNSIKLDDDVKFIRVHETASTTADSSGLDIQNLTDFTIRVKQVLRDSAKPLLIVADFLSPIVFKAGLDRAYSLLAEILEECKQHEGLYLFLLENEMHDSKQLSTIERIFDGVMEFSPYEKDGITIRPLLGLKKMTGIPLPIKPVELDALKREGTHLITSRKEIAEQGYKEIVACKKELIISVYGNELWEAYKVVGPLYKKIVKQGGVVKIVTNIEKSHAAMFLDYIKSGIMVKHLDEEHIVRFFMIDSKRGFFSLTRPVVDSMHEKLEQYEGHDSWISTNEAREIKGLHERFESEWSDAINGASRLMKLKAMRVTH